MKKQFTKVLAVLLTLCMLTGMMIMPAGATETQQSNTALIPDTSWFRGTIVEEYKPQTYEISTAAQLLGFAEIAQTYDFAGDTVKLMADIDLNAGWDATTTIGSDGTVTLANAPANVWTVVPTFKGTLDGNGHTISGIYSASEFTVPETSQRYVGGFINELVNGTVKNLIVKNSLATFSSPTGESGTSRIRIGGFISRVVDSNVENIYGDIDAWMMFDYHYTMGGLICSIEASEAGGTHNGTIKNIVGAGCVGRIVNGKCNVKGSETGDIYLGNVIGFPTDDLPTVVLENISFIGWCNGKYCRDTLKTTKYTGDIAFADKYSTINFSTTAYSLYSNEFVDNYKVSDLDAKAWCYVDGANGEPDYESDSTYREMGFKLHTFIAGNGSEVTGVLPGAVVDMLTANTSNLYLQESLDESKIRFIGVVNISEEEFENFSKLGFDITMTYNGRTFTNTYTTTTVYTSLIANGTPVLASEYGGTYFYAVEITGLDAATAGDVVFNVDGITIHAGETTTNVFGSGEYTYSAN